METLMIYVVDLPYELKRAGAVGVLAPVRLTVCVTRWWAGRDNAALPEST